MLQKITSDEELTAIYGDPLERSLTKEIDYISDHYRAFIDACPFVVVATNGPGGLDCSPRGDPPGFIRVVDAHTILLPDRRGNNRIDSLRNLINDPHISLLFLIPGVGETLRINGRAEIIVEPDLLNSFEMQGKIPRSVLKVTVDRIYYQCPKALVRSKLWQADAQIDRAELPSAGDIQQALSGGELDGAEYDRDYPARIKETMY